MDGGVPLRDRDPKVPKHSLYKDNRDFEVPPVTSNDAFLPVRTEHGNLTPLARLHLTTELVAKNLAEGWNAKGPKPGSLNLWACR